MTRLFLTIISALILSLVCSAQPSGITREQLEKKKQEMLKYKHCIFENLSKPETHQETYELKSGKTISVLSQSDYSRDAFATTDEILKEFAEWKNSPYYYRLNHRTSGKALLDSEEMDMWVKNSFDKIAKSYFEDNKDSFHITAHGLTGADGAGDKIRINGQELDAKETAELVFASMLEEYNTILNIQDKPFTIVLHSCNTAAGDNNFAMQLSRELSSKLDNVYVVGAPDYVWANITPEGKYEEYVASEDGVKWYTPEKKNWVVYKNGKDTGQGRQGYSETLKTIQELK